MMISEGWKTGRFLAVGSTAMLLGLGSQWVWSSLYEVESADVEDVSAQGKVCLLYTSDAADDPTLVWWSGGGGGL